MESHQEGLARRAEEAQRYVEEHHTEEEIAGRESEIG